MTLPQIYIFNEIQYHHSDDIFDMDEVFFNRINKSRNIRDIVKLYKVPVDEYIYAKYKDDIWIPDKITNKRAKLFISTSWTYKNVPQFMLITRNMNNNIIYNNNITKENIKEEEEICLNNNNIKYNNIKEDEYNDIKDDEYNNIKEDEYILNNNMKEDEENITNNDIIESKYEYLQVPERIVLEEHEMFRDNDNVIYDIIMVGKRHVNGCYFNVKNISEIFEIPNLQIILIDKQYNTYTENLHYKYFVTKNPIKTTHNTIKKDKRTNKTTKKELFLTYIGLLQVLFSSRSKKIMYNRYVIKKWLDIFDKSVFKQYILNDVPYYKTLIGYVYIVYSSLLNAIKIGYWTGSINALKSRYVTYYGSNIEISYYYTINARDLEYKTHRHFKQYNIINELYKKEYLELYTTFISNNAIEPDDEDIINMNNNMYNINNINNLIVDDIKEYTINNISDKNIITSFYLFKIGTCKDLRQSFNIPLSYDDDLILCKYGRTNDLSRRTLEHNDTFKKIKTIDDNNVKIDLMLYTMIDNAFTSDAESDLRTFITQFNYTFNTSEELIIINNITHLKLITTLYNTISSKYAGQHEKLISGIKELENTIKQQELILNNIELQYEKDIIILKEQHKNELLQEQYENKLLREQQNTLKEQYENKLLQQELTMLKAYNKLQQELNESKMLLLSNNIKN